MLWCLYRMGHGSGFSLFCYVRTQGSPSYYFHPPPCEDTGKKGRSLDLGLFYLQNHDRNHVCSFKFPSPLVLLQLVLARVGCYKARASHALGTLCMLPDPFALLYYVVTQVPSLQLPESWAKKPSSFRRTQAQVFFNNSRNLVNVLFHVAVSSQQNYAIKSTWHIVTNQLQLTTAITISTAFINQ